MKGFKTMQHNLLKMALMVGLTLGSTIDALAAQAGSVSVKNVAETEVKVLENGATVVKRVPVQKALPNTEIIYTTTFKNIIDKPVADIVIDNPIPNDSSYKAGTAIGNNTVISYSVNGGKTYGSPESLKIKAKDGKERIALPTEYTHVRWVYQGTLAAGKSSEVSFRTIVK
jgi:uncharacterized repeat protein (TIGR01451 family)